MALSFLGGLGGVLRRLMSLPIPNQRRKHQVNSVIFTRLQFKTNDGEWPTAIGLEYHFRILYHIYSRR